jgi:ELWxxDGT repeat protein
MKTFISLILGVITILISIQTLAAEQKTFEVNSNRELTRVESSVPTFYQEHGPYLFFLSQPYSDSSCCSALQAYGSNSLWRLDSRDNSVNLVISDIEGSSYEKTNPYAILNDRIIYFSRAGLFSVDLFGLDKKQLSQLQHSRLNNFGNQMASYNGYVYFPTIDKTNSTRFLWRTNGTAKGTSKVELCEENTCYQSPKKMVVSNNKLFLIASSPENNHRIWSINNNNKVSIISSQTTILNAYGMFTSPSGIQFNVAEQLWFSDGTNEGTYPIDKEARDSIGFGESIIVSRPGDITIIKDKGKGTKTTISFSHFANTNLIVLNDTIYFVSSHKLIAVDITTEQPREIFDFEGTNETSYKIIGGKGNKLILLVDDPKPKIPRREIWISDGTAEGSIKLKDNGVHKAFWDLNAWHFLNNDMYFTAFTEEHGIELWRTDGTPEGTLLAKDIGYGQTKVQKGPIASNGKDVFYSMKNIWYGSLGGIVAEHTEQELWKTDAVTMRSSKVPQWKYPKNRLAKIITVEGGQYWWREHEFKSDEYHLDFYDYQSEEVTPVITDILGQCINYALPNRKMAIVGNKYFFQAPVVNDDSWSCQLWVSDGTVDGTMPITNLPKTSIHKEIISNIVVYQDEVYFSLLVQEDEHLPLRTAIFKTDGTIDGTGEAFRLSTSGEDANYYIVNMMATSQGIFISTGNGLSNLWFWQPAGINKIIEGSNTFSHQSFALFKEGVSFVNDNSIWSSDGTVDGTLPMILLEEFEGKSNYISTLHSTPDYEKIIYGSIDSQGDNRLWVSDGTILGTKTKGPIINDNNFIVNAFSDNDFYITDFSGVNGKDFYQDFKRISLEGDTVELIMQKLAISGENFPAKIVEAQGRIFIGQESEIISYYGPGFGGPYVTAKLKGDDFDNDGVSDDEDMFPLHLDEYIDTDKDNVGDNFDNDDDNDGIEDELDLFSLDATEWADHDGDGIGDIADTDDDNDGVNDWFDSYPTDSTRSANKIIVDNGASDKITTKSESSGGVIHYYIVLYVLLTLRLRRRFR